MQCNLNGCQNVPMVKEENGYRCPNCHATIDDAYAKLLGVGSGQPDVAAVVNGDQS